MKKWSLLILFAVLTGCAGLADYTIDLDNGFRIDRLSAHQIVIYGDVPIKSDNDSFDNHLYVPARVTDVWWDDHYIVAKQLVLNDGEPPEKPTEADFQYWIIDVNDHAVVGPLYEEIFEREIEKMGISDLVTFTAVEDLKKVEEN